MVPRTASSTVVPRVVLCMTTVLSVGPVPRNEGQDRGGRSPPHQWHAPVFRSWTGLAPATPSCATGMHPPRTVRLSCCSAWHGGPAIPSQAALVASVGVYACSCTCFRAHMLAASVECECGRASAGSLTPTLPLWKIDKGHHRPHCHWLPMALIDRRARPVSQY